MVYLLYVGERTDLNPPTTSSIADRDGATMIHWLIDLALNTPVIILYAWAITLGIAVLMPRSIQ
jgi:hypothetical protein